MPKNQTSFTNTNKAAVTHGIYSFEANGPGVLSPVEVASLQELRELAMTEQGRTEIKVEVTARLTVIVQKAFADMMESQKGAGWWNSGVVGRGGTYLAELRRWLLSFPPDRGEVIDVGTFLSKYRPNQDKDGGNDA